MSWIFFLLLVGYGLVRLCLRVRGNLRYLRARKDDAPLREVMEVPDHLHGGIADLFAQNEALGRACDERRRALDMIVHVDPDARFGDVRDGRYRRTVIEVGQFVERWHRTFEAMSEAERQRAEDWGVHGAEVRAVRERLQPIVRTVTRARALEPFPMTQVQIVREAMVQLLDETASLRRRLCDAQAHPYRGAAAAPPVPAMPASEVAGVSNVSGTGLAAMAQ